MMNKILTVLTFLILTFHLAAQEKMRVERGDAVDKSKPIWNVFVDEDNQKWVGNSEGLFKVLSINNAVKESLRADEWALLQYRSGNANLRVSKTGLKKFIPDLTDINAAHLDKNKQHLWIGTTETGLYQFSLTPLKLIQHFTSDNSDLEVNFINFIEIEPSGRMWIGTPEGVVWGRNGRWNLDEKYLAFVGVAFNGTKTYVISEEWLWEVTTKNKWKEIELDPRQHKGLLIDAELDSKNRLWLASEIVTRMDAETGTIEPFAAPEYYTSEFAAQIKVDQDDALWVGTRDKGLFIIEKEDAITVSVLVENPISCGAFEFDGSLAVVVEGGKPPYAYSWNDPKMKGVKPGNLAPGEYTVTVTDSQGKNKSASVMMNDPAVKLTVKQDRPESGIGAGDAAATVAVTGGVPEYKFIWDNQESKATAEKLTGGSHTVTVTDDAGCSNTATVEIQQNIADLAIVIEEAAPLNCANSSEAALMVSVEGGKPPYNFLWNNDQAKGAAPENLAAGNYEITVSDASGKSSVAKYTIAAPETLMLTVAVTAPASTGSADGKATVKVSGGTPPYSYEWDTKEKEVEAVKLGAGNHQVIVTDANGCNTTAGFTIDENILSLNATIEGLTELKCADTTDGILKVNVNGGKPPYKFVWSNPKLTGDNPTELPAGKYTVTITDASGKSSEASAEIKGPKVMTGELTVTASANLGKDDGKAKVKVKGGTGKYSYKWSSGEIRDAAKALGAGAQNVIVSDENGCSVKFPFEITEDILPMNVTVEATTPINCYGEKTGTLSANVNGGKPPYDFKWKGTDTAGKKAENLSSGKYELVVTDAEGTVATATAELESPDAIKVEITVAQNASVNENDGKAKASVKGGNGPYTYSWDNGEKKDTAEKLGLGTHTVDIKDSNGCTGTASIDITEDILPMNITAEVTREINCFGENTGSLLAAVNGGKPPYSYQWKGTDATSEKAENLAGGKYEIVVTDKEGTTATATVELETPSEIKITAEVAQPATANNKDGKAKATVSGGKKPYTYSWDTGEKTDTAEKLGVGNHTVEIMDSKGCTATASVDVTEDILPLTVSVKVDQEIDCHGNNSGVATAEVTGGKSPFKYTWDNGQKGPSLKKLAAGDYTLEVEDASGLKKTAKVSLAQPEPLGIELKKVPASTEVSSDGKVTATGVGGSNGYTFTWSTGASGPMINKLAAGSYNVAVKDGNGCTADLKFDVKNKQIPELTAATLQKGQTMRLEKLYFKADSSSIEPSSLPTMDELFEFLTENGSVAIEIGGHTNNIPSHEFCDRLSEERAKAVADYLVSKGIDPRRVLYKGYGKRKPKFTNKTKDGRRKNQRVEVKVLSI